MRHDALVKTIRDLFESARVENNLLWPLEYHTDEGDPDEMICTVCGGWTNQKMHTWPTSGHLSAFNSHMPDCPYVILQALLADELKETTDDTQHG